MQRFFSKKIFKKIRRIFATLTVGIGLLLGSFGLALAATTIGANITFDTTGGSLQTGIVDNDTLTLEAYNGGAYVVFATLTANSSPTMDLSSAVTMGDGNTIYYAGGATDVAVTDGGTGASTASGARTNLDLVIGTNVQASDAGLLSIAGLTTSADTMIYTTGLDVYVVATLTTTGRSILDDDTTGDVRTTLGLVIDTDVQAWDADLDSWATKTAPSGVAVGTTDTQTLTDKTLTAPTIGGHLTKSVQAGVTADTTGSQASGVSITADLVEVAVATAGDSVTLPTAVAGLQVIVTNHGGASMDLFPNSGDAINEGSTDAQLAVLVNATVLCYAYDATNWECLTFTR